MRSETSSAARQDPSRALAAILDGERAVFDDLAELARAFRRALTDADARSLDRLADRAQTLATQFEMLEVERMRLEAQQIDETGEVGRAREAFALSLQRLLREGAVSGTVLDRLADTAEARRAAVAGLFGSAYLADGRSAPWRIQGAGLSREG
ncbi:MAG TPA: hypothetical protein ENK10_02280 [Acidobacteria bacterium]|nr:hypothetical protein [Acidobacteriota bacterium]